MKPQNYTTYAEASASFNEQNLAKTYFSRLIPLSLNITEENFEEVAETIYDLCHEAGDELRGGRGHAGGGRDDIRVALSIAADIELVVDFYSENSRNFKNSISKKLRTAWLSDDIDVLLYILCGIERNAAMAIIDHQESDLVAKIEDFYELDFGDEAAPAEKCELPDLVEITIMNNGGVKRKKFGGNLHKPRKKPAPRASKQLEMEF